jgi:hypothetical protein
MTNHRIKFKLPDGTEFEADGARDDVKADYAAFLDHLKSAAPAKPPSSPKTPNNAGAVLEGEPDDALIKRIFDLAEDGLISLKVFPRGDNAEADGLLLLLYGYQRIAKNDHVFAVTLSRAARKSGLQFDRVDRLMETQRAYIGRGGQRRSTTYTLNNQGVAQAARIAMSLLE